MMSHLQYELAIRNLQVMKRGLEAEILRSAIQLDGSDGFDPQLQEYIRQLQVKKAFLRQKEQEIESQPRLAPTLRERILVRMYDWATKERFSGK